LKGSEGNLSQLAEWTGSAEAQSERKVMEGKRTIEPKKIRKAALTVMGNYP